MNSSITRYMTPVIFLFFTGNLIAQDSLQTTHCCCNRPGHLAPTGVMIDHVHSKRSWMFSYRLMNMNMQGNLTRQEKVSREEVYQNYIMNMEAMSMQMHMLMIMYGISDRFTIMGMGGYVFNAMEMSMQMHGGAHSGHGGGSRADAEMRSVSKASGISDTRLYLLYSPRTEGNQELLISTGISFPTGSVSLTGTDMMGEVRKLTYSLQTGTGSIAILPGLTYTGYIRNYSWGIQLSADVKANINTAGYKFGDELTSSAWIYRSWNDWISNSLRVSSSVIGKIRGFDPEIAVSRTTEADADIVNSGSFYSSIHAGLNVRIPQGFLNGNSLGVEYGVPFYQYVSGIQMRKRSLISVAWQYSF